MGHSSVHCRPASVAPGEVTLEAGGEGGSHAGGGRCLPGRGNSRYNDPKKGEHLTGSRYRVCRCVCVRALTRTRMHLSVCMESIVGH